MGNPSGSGRENLGSRLGFILLTAGCAIGLGNIWRFPFITGKYGGAIFVLVYLLFLLLLDLLHAVIKDSLPALHFVPLSGGQVQCRCQIGGGGAGFIGMLKLPLGRLVLVQALPDFFQFLLLLFHLPGKGLDLPFPVGPPGRSADIPGRLLRHALPLQHPLTIPAIGGKPGMALRLLRKTG